MKIGILTFHCAHNYGAVLQCYALQETLKSMGHDVEVIDYRPKYLVAPYKKFYINRFISGELIKTIKKIIREFLLFNIRFKRYYAFNHFIKTYFNLSEKIQGNNIPSKYDVYIMGSDQIWNPCITLAFDDVYFGNFIFSKNDKKYIAYAASLGISSLNEDAKKYFQSALNNFNGIGVRESSMVKILQPLTNKKIEIVLDPTLLVNPKIWDNITKTPIIKGKYVLIYQVKGDENTKRIAELIAKEIGANVIELTAIISARFNKNKLQYESPENFLGFIKNASFIVTTSFHGTAFSIIFNRPFYSISLGGNDTRVLSILKNVGLENRLIPKDCSPKFSEIDYSDVNINISKLRNKSKDFLIKEIGQ